MKKLVSLCCIFLFSVGLTGFGCPEKNAEPGAEAVAQDPALENADQAPAQGVEPALQVKSTSRVANPSEPPAVPKHAQRPAQLGADKKIKETGSGGDVNIQAQFQVDEHSEGSVTVKSTVGVGGAGINLHINLPAASEHEPSQEPIARPAAHHGRETCKSVLLAKGHPASSLIHCDDVNQACAVALLRAGHSPSQLVHCEDVSDLACALQILRSGREPSEIVHCD